MNTTSRAILQTVIATDSTLSGAELGWVLRLINGEVEVAPIPATADEVSAAETSTPKREVPPVALDVGSACRVLGNISRTTLYRLLVRGRLARLPGTRKVLVTRRSIERFCNG